MKIDTEKLKKFEKLPPDVKRELALVMAKWKEKKKESQIRSDFMSFVKHVWPEFVEGKHHKVIAEKFNQIAEKKIIFLALFYYVYTLIFISINRLNPVIYMIHNCPFPDRFKIDLRKTFFLFPCAF